MRCYGADKNVALQIKIWVVSSDPLWKYACFTWRSDHKSIGIHRHSAAEMTLKPRLFDQIFVLFPVIRMIALGNEVT